MTMLDGALEMAGGLDVAGLAANVGLTPEQVQSALAALVRSQGDPGDLAGMAAAKTQLPLDKVQQILAAVGGRDALGRIAAAIGHQGGLGGLAAWNTPPQN